MKSPGNGSGRVSPKLIILLVAVAGWLGRPKLFEEPEKPIPYSTPPNRNTRADVAYVGDQVYAAMARLPRRSAITRWAVP